MESANQFCVHAATPRSFQKDLRLLKSYHNMKNTWKKHGVVRNSVSGQLDAKMWPNRCKSWLQIEPQRQDPGQILIQISFLGNLKVVVRGQIDTRSCSTLHDLIVSIKSILSALYNKFGLQNLDFQVTINLSIRQSFKSTPNCPSQNLNEKIELEHGRKNYFKISHLT